MTKAMGNVFSIPSGAVAEISDGRLIGSDYRTTRSRLASSIPSLARPLDGAPKGFLVRPETTSHVLGQGDRDEQS